MKGTFCCTCLVHEQEARLFAFDRSNLKSFIERIFKLYDVHQIMYEALYVCYECKALLDKANKFVQKALTAQQILQALCREPNKITLKQLKAVNRKQLGLVTNLTFKELYYIDYYCSGRSSYDNEPTVKEEPDEDELELDIEPDEDELELDIEPDEHELDIDADPLAKLEIKSESDEIQYEPNTTLKSDPAFNDDSEFQEEDDIKSSQDNIPISTADDFTPEDNSNVIIIKVDNKHYFNNNQNESSKSDTHTDTSRKKRRRKGSKTKLVNPYTNRMYRKKQLTTHQKGHIRKQPKTQDDDSILPETIHDLPIKIINDSEENSCNVKTITVDNNAFNFNMSETYEIETLESETEMDKIQYDSTFNVTETYEIETHESGTETDKMQYDDPSTIKEKVKTNKKDEKSAFMLSVSSIAEKKRQRKIKKYAYSDEDVTEDSELEGKDYEYEPQSSNTSDEDFDNELYNEHGKRIKLDLRKYPMQCDHCEAEIPEKKVHYIHYIIAHPKIKYPYGRTRLNFLCQICGHISHKKSYHDMHEMTHAGLTFYCDKCPKKYITPDRLKNHLRIVHTDKFMECDYCGKKFKTRLEIRRHLLVHTGEKAYQCHICSAGYSKRGKLDMHIRSTHPGPSGKSKQNNKGNQSQTHNSR